MRHLPLLLVLPLALGSIACASIDQGAAMAADDDPILWEWALPMALGGDSVVTSTGSTLGVDDLPRTRRGDTVPDRRRLPRERPDRDPGVYDRDDGDRRDEDDDWDDEDDWEDERDDEWDDRDDDEWDERGRADRRGPDRGRERGRDRDRDDRYGEREADDDVPPFCRDGRGHPRFGMEWCREKGYVGGGVRDRGDEGVPAFCRTGEGHPVFGMEWCRERAAGDRDPDWRRADVDRVRLPSPRREPVVVREGTLGEILGGRLLGDLRTTGDWLGGRGEVDGVLWRPTDDPGVSVLQVRVGGVPVAELTDLDGDGIVDATLVMD